MNKILSYTAIAATALTLSSTAYAENTGCGVGSMLFNGNKGIASNVFAITTNFTALNTFAVTSGTSGCSKTSAVRSSSRLFSFADDNLTQLASDTAKGNGAYLESAAQILEVSQDDKAHFFNVMQSNFSNIFESENTNTASVVSSISKVMKADKVLKSYAI
jgi:hypothetical protein